MEEVEGLSKGQGRGGWGLREGAGLPAGGRQGMRKEEVRWQPLAPSCDPIPRRPGSARPLRHGRASRSVCLAVCLFCLSVMRLRADSTAACSPAPAYRPDTSPRRLPVCLSSYSHAVLVNEIRSLARLPDWFRATSIVYLFVAIMYIRKYGWSGSCHPGTELVSR